MLCQKFEIAISAGGKSKIMMKSPDDQNFSPLGQVFHPAHGHFVLLGKFTKEMKKWPKFETFLHFWVPYTYTKALKTFSADALVPYGKNETLFMKM